MRRPGVIAGLTIAAVLCACARAPAQSGETDAPAIGTQEAATSMAPMGEVPAGLLESIVADAAERTRVEPDDVEIATAEAVTWSDGSLGCPQPGMMYTQALVPGYRVVVRAAGETLSYHAGQTGEAGYCEHPRPPAESSGSQ